MRTNATSTLGLVVGSLRLPRLGLQWRMAASYVAVTAAAVILVEAVTILALLPPVLQQLDLDRRVSATASITAKGVAQVNRSTGGISLPDGFVVGDPAVDPTMVTLLGAGIAIPQIDADLRTAPAVAALILDVNGFVRASSYPLRFPLGSAAQSFTPIVKLIAGHGTAEGAHGSVTWSLEPIVYIVEGPSVVIGPKTEKVPQKVFAGWVYVEAPDRKLPAGGPEGVAALGALASLPDSSVGPLLAAGAALLVLLLPLGTAFGIWTSRRLVRRLGELANATGDFAAGDLARRVPEEGRDEVGRVEQGFNDMAERIQLMTTEQGRLVGEHARTQERARIAGEIHDSISQDLFSISLIAGGLERALPQSSPLQAEITAMRERIAGTMTEMRALLLELRPTALDERGLVPALNDLCAAYHERLGVRIDASLESIDMGAPADHAVLRVAQEGIANAVRHADARHIELRLEKRDGRVELTVADDGRGFDEATSAGHGLGLVVMRERIRELGGSIVIRSEPGHGTSLVASLPA